MHWRSDEAHSEGERGGVTERGGKKRGEQLVNVADNLYFSKGIKGPAFLPLWFQVTFCECFLITGTAEPCCMVDLEELIQFCGWILGLKATPSKIFCKNTPISMTAWGHSRGKHSIPWKFKMLEFSEKQILVPSMVPSERNIIKQKPCSDRINITWVGREWEIYCALQHFNNGNITIYGL